MPKYDYVKFSAGPLPYRIDDPQIETKDFNKAISHLQKREKGTITATVCVPVDTEVFAFLTKEDMAGKTRAQILDLFDAEIGRVIARIPSLPNAYD